MTCKSLTYDIVMALWANVSTAADKRTSDILTFNGQRTTTHNLLNDCL